MSNEPVLNRSGQVNWTCVRFFSYFFMSSVCHLKNLGQRDPGTPPHVQASHPSPLAWPLLPLLLLGRGDAKLLPHHLNLSKRSNQGRTHNLELHKWFCKLTEHTNVTSKCTQSKIWLFLCSWLGMLERNQIGPRTDRLKAQALSKGHLVQRPTITE